jgi:hypothetical protein
MGAFGRIWVHYPAFLTQAAVLDTKKIGLVNATDGRGSIIIGTCNLHAPESCSSLWDVRLSVSLSEESINCGILAERMLSSCKREERLREREDRLRVS